MRLGYRVAYRVIQAWTFVLRPEVPGTMVAVTDPAGRVLLVRHTYGDRARWELPGGWVQAGEDPAEAARREVLEEVGIDVPLRAIGVVDGDWNFKHEHLSMFQADWPGGRRRYDPVEIAEVAWFGLDDLPERCSEATRTMLGHLAASS
jgi:8-oxo-dGTP pyrophosphatase MutT (NUDIX family)